MWGRNAWRSPAGCRVVQYPHLCKLPLIQARLHIGRGWQRRRHNRARIHSRPNRPHESALFLHAQFGVCRFVYWWALIFRERLRYVFQRFISSSWRSQTSGRRENMRIRRLIGRRVVGFKFSIWRQFESQMVARPPVSSPSSAVNWVSRVWHWSAPKFGTIRSAFYFYANFIRMTKLKLSAVKVQIIRVSLLNPVRLVPVESVSVATVRLSFVLTSSL